MTDKISYVHARIVEERLIFFFSLLCVSICRRDMFCQYHGSNFFLTFLCSILVSEIVILCNLIEARGTSTHASQIQILYNDGRSVKSVGERRI